MELKDSTATDPLQAPGLTESTLVRTAARMRKFSASFGWPMLVLMVVGPSHLQEMPTQYLLFLLFFGIGPVLCGLFLRIWCRGFIRREGFVLDGPYRYVRNPVELGALLCYFGASVLLSMSAWYILLMMILAWGYLSIVGLAHDQDLLKRFGTIYLRYMQRVHRWVPNGLPATNRTYRNYSLLRGVFFEKEDLIWLLGFAAVFAVKKRFG